MYTLHSLYSHIARACVLFAFGILFLHADSFAQIPHTFSYQGRITESGGRAISDGLHVFKVLFYQDPTGGTPVYTESLSTQTKEGLFNITIGMVVPIPSTLRFDRTYYLSIAIDGQSEMEPRTALMVVPYALHSEVADYAKGLSSDVKGVVTSVNEISGSLHIIGDSTIEVSPSGRSIQLHATSKNIQAIRFLSDTEQTMIISNAAGPNTTIGVADNAITTKKISERAVTPSKISQSGATNGQVLKWDGRTWIPSDDDNFSPVAGNDITIKGNSISVMHPLPPGTVNNSTLRWTGTIWEENTNLLSTSAGLTTVNNNIHLSNNGQASELRFFEPVGSGSHFTSFKAQPQNSDIQYTFPASLPSTLALLTVDNSGFLNWSSSFSFPVPFDKITTATNNGQVLTVGNGSSVLPEGTGIIRANQFTGSGSVTNAVDLATAEVGGILPIANGGTNSGTSLANDRMMISKNGAIVEFDAGVYGQTLISRGNNAPTWLTINFLPTGTTDNSTLRWNSSTSTWQENMNVLATAAGFLTVNNGLNLNTSSSPLQLNGSAGSNGQFLMSAGAGNTPTWVTGNLLPNGTGTDNTLRWNGTSWVETANVRSSAAGLVTANAGVNLNGGASPLQLNGSTGNTGQFLMSNGAGNTPTWATANSLTSGTLADNTLRWNGSGWVETANVRSSAAGLVTANGGVNLNGATSPLQLNSAAGTPGQVLISNGPASTPIWNTVNLLPTGTATDNTLRWNGSSWVETANVKSSAAGLVTANAGVNLNGVSSPLQANGSSGSAGQFLSSAGTGSTPVWTSLTAGSNIILTASSGALSISAAGILSNGTATDNTLRWNGSSWVETANVKSSAAGLVTTNAGMNLNSTASPLQLNGAAGTSGQFLTSAGAGSTPTWTTGSLLSNGTATDNTLRWNGSSWVETSNVKSSAAGLVTTNAGVNLNSTASPLQLNGAAGTTGQFLTSAGAGATPTWTTGSLLANGTATDNTLRWNGASWVETANVKSSAAGLVTTNAGVNLNSTASPLQLNGAAGTSGQFLTSAGAGATPTWTTGSLLTNGTATDNTLRWNGSAWVETANVRSSAAGLVTTNAGVNLNSTASPLQLNGVAGTTGQFLTSAGAGATPTWTTGSLLTNGTATDNTLRWNGSSWVETANVKSSAAGLVTVNAGVNLNSTASPLQLNGAAGTSGQFLTSAGAGATPTWTTGSLLSNGTATDNTLRWNGSSWVETANVKSSAGGLVTVNAGVNLNGAASSLQANGSAGSTGQILASTGSGSTPAWTTLTAGSNITITPSAGVLTIAATGGIADGTATDNTLRWNGSSWVETANVKSSAAGLITTNAGVNLNSTASPLQLNGAAGTTGQFLTSAGAGATPTWTTGSLLSNGTATDNTLRWNGSAWVETANVKSSAAGLVTVNAGVNLNSTASPLQLNGAAGTSGQFLTSAGTGATPTWTTGSLLTNGTATDNTLRWNGSSWVETSNVKSSAAGLVTVNAGVNLNSTASPFQLNGAAGTTGQFLTSAGAGATPTWTTGSLLANGTATDNTLRWNGAAWIETSNVRSSSAGLVTVNNGVNLNGTISALQLNGVPGTTGQFLTSAGVGSTPTWTTGNLLSDGTATDNTLRWNGSSWVETANVKSSAVGLVTVNAGVNLNGTASSLQANGSAGTSGQILSSAGAGSTPTWTTLTAGSNITITPSAGALTIAASGGITNGTATDNTLRWNGSAWVETANVKSSAAGLVTTNAGVNLNSTASPLQLNGAAGTTGQFLTSAGTGATPTWTTGSLLSNGTATDNTLRWNGSSWVETANVKSSAAGLVTVNAGVNLNGTASPLQANGSAGTSGQFLSSTGTGSTPLWTTLTAGKNITLTSSAGALTIDASGGVANGTATDNTLRWNGSSWVETANVKSSAAGLVTTNAGVNLNSTASPLQLNGAAGTSGQFLTSAGTGATPTWTTGSLLTNGTATDNTLRWNGSSWVETTNVKSSAAGLVTANAGVNLNGAASPLQANGSAGTSGQILSSAGAGSTPSWTTLTAGSNITITPSAGALTIAASGGVSNGTATDNTLRWNGSSWVETANVKSSAAGLVTTNAGVNLNSTASPLQLNGAAGTTGQFLTSAGAGATPTWTTGSLLTNGTATDNTLRWNGSNWVETANVKSSAAGLVTTNAGVNLNSTASPLQLNGAAGTTGQFLTSAGASATPTWTTGSLLGNGTATDNTLRWNGTSWVETGNVKSSAAGLVTTNAGVNLNGASSPLQANGAAGTSGQVLTSAGAGLTPTWSTVNILTNGTANDNTLRWNGSNWVETANIKSSTAGLLTANAGVNHNGATSPLQLNGAAGTTGQFLTSAGAGNTPTWTTGSLLSNGTATDNTLRWSGTAWVESANIKSSSTGLLTVSAGITISNTTSPLKVRGSDGTANYVLSSQGAGNTPQWSDPNSLVTNAWKLSGNSGTSPGMGGGQNFVGTTDTKDLYFGTNGLEHLRISSTSSSTSTPALGVLHTKSVLPGGGSGLITGMTVETLLPSSATNPVVPVGGLFSYSTVNNSFSLGVFCAVNSSVFLTGTANTSTVRALDGIYYSANTTNGITHSSAIGVYGSIQTTAIANNTTITNASALRSDFQLYSTNSTITNGYGLYIENPILGFGASGSSITNYNGIYIENLTVGSTKRAFYYDGSSGNVPVAITSAGQLGIGRNDPTQALEIRNGNILLSNNNNTAGELRLAEPSTSGAYYSSFKSGAQSATINYTLPLSLPSASSGFLLSSTTGTMSWGSNLAWDNTNSRLGANTTSPSTTADVNGDLALRENGYTAANGNNNDISIGNFSFVRVSGPNAAFTITGISGGVNGKMVILYNSTAQNMTISHNDNNSTTAGNRIFCKGSANYVVGQYGVVSLMYNSTDSRWVVVSTN